MKNNLIIYQDTDELIRYIYDRYMYYSICKPYEPNYLLSFIYPNNKEQVLLEIKKFSMYLIDPVTIHSIVPERFIESCNELYNLLSTDAEEVKFVPKSVKINRKNCLFTFIFTLNEEKNKYVVTSINVI